MAPWAESVRRLLAERFCARFDDEDAMVDAFIRHNGKVREGVAPERLVEWTSTDGWEPICQRRGIEVPTESFPPTNDAGQWRAAFGLPPR